MLETHLNKSSIHGNKGITDKSVPAFKEMLRSSNITNKEYLLTFVLFCPFILI